MTQEELIHRRATLKAKPAADVINGEVHELLSRLKTIPDSEAEKLRRPEFEDPTAPAIRKVLKDAGFPERHLELSAPDVAGKWEEKRKFLSDRLGSGFLCALIGSRGVGKTQMGTTLAVEVVRSGKTARFATATRFLMEIKETYGKKDAPKTERQVIVEYSKPKLLIIDELGRRGETDWEDRLLFELLNDRYNAMHDTIVLSNHPTVAEFSKAVGDSLVSRIDETGGVIVCDWKSYRTK